MPDGVARDAGGGRGRRAIEHLSATLDDVWRLDLTPSSQPPGRGGGRGSGSRTSNRIIPASLSSQNSLRMSSTAARYRASARPSASAHAAPGPSRASAHPSCTARRHRSASFPRHRPSSRADSSNHARVSSRALAISRRVIDADIGAPDMAPTAPRDVTRRPRERSKIAFEPKKKKRRQTRGGEGAKHKDLRRSKDRESKQSG